MSSEATALSKLIGDIYDSALDPQLWTRALEWPRGAQADGACLTIPPMPK